MKKVYFLIAIMVIISFLILLPVSASQAEGETTEELSSEEMSISIPADPFPGNVDYSNSIFLDMAEQCAEYKAELLARIDQYEAQGETPFPTEIGNNMVFRTEYYSLMSYTYSLGVDLATIQPEALREYVESIDGVGKRDRKLYWVLASTPYTVESWFDENGNVVFTYPGDRFRNHKELFTFFEDILSSKVKDSELYSEEHPITEMQYYKLGLSGTVMLYLREGAAPIVHCYNASHSVCEEYEYSQFLTYYKAYWEYLDAFLHGTSDEGDIGAGVSFSEYVKNIYGTDKDIDRINSASGEKGSGKDPIFTIVLFAGISVAVVAIGGITAAIVVKKKKAGKA